MRTPADEPAYGTYWEDFQVGVARAERELGQLAANLMRLPHIAASPSNSGLDTPGKLAGYFARVAEALRRDHDPPAARMPRSVLQWFAGMARSDSRIADCCAGAEGIQPTAVIRFSDDVAGRRAAARVIELLAEMEGDSRHDC